MVDSHDWICIHIARSLPEAYLLRSVLETHGIRVCICEPPVSQLHDYLHDPQERIRVFVPATEQSQGRSYTEAFLKTQQQIPQATINYTP